jgi:hypothetical protein
MHNIFYITYRTNHPRWKSGALIRLGLCHHLTKVPQVQKSGTMQVGPRKGFVRVSGGNKLCSYKEASSARLWFNRDFANTIDLAFLGERTSELYNHGLRHVADVWNPKFQRCFTWAEVQERY